MIRLISLLAVVSAATPALANGRSPGASTIHFQPGNENHVINGMTFGAVYSKDGGATWTWTCEDAVGYGGTYDPDYAITPTGAVFGTTFNGLKVNRNGCVFDASVLSPDNGSDPPKFVSGVTVASNGAIFASPVDAADNNIYRSDDDGQTFPVMAQPPGSKPNDWWQSLEVARSNPSIVYLAGYRAEGGGRTFLMYRSANAGQSYTALPLTGLITTVNSTIEFVGIGATDPNLVYARVTLWQDLIGDALFRSTDGGQSWTKVLDVEGQLFVVVRNSGQVVAATQVLGTQVSNDQGATWTALTNPPHINCITESAGGEVWACTQNYGTPQTPGDGFGIMKSRDLATWTGVLKFQDIKSPEPCAAGTIQKDKCDTQLWCGLCAQLGCTAGRDCGVVPDGPPVDGPVATPPRKGCCQTGSDGAIGLLMIGCVVAIVIMRRPRRSISL